MSERPGERTFILKFKKKELDKEFEVPLCNAFYWSAYYGDKEKIRSMIVDYKWSPFIRAFNKRNILTAAIMGKQDYVVERILTRDFYSTADKQYFIDNLYKGYDSVLRSPMHYAYLNNDDSIIQLLKDAGFKKDHKRDVWGTLPE